MAFLLLIGIPFIVATGCLAWKFRFDRGTGRQPDAPTRRREDARDWQRRFDAGSPLPANFFPPTQNEILETLLILDHLTPGWEKAGPDKVELSFLNELALNFPSLRKAASVFPIASAENADQADLDARREAFRTRRAQFNAMTQIVSGAGNPTEIADRAPFDLPGEARGRSAGNFWPVLLGGAAVLVAASLCAVRFFPATANLNTAKPQVSQPSPTPAPVMVEAEPAPAPAATVAAARSSPTPPPAPPAQVAESRPVLPAAATPSPQKAALSREIAASKLRAVAKYPALTVAGSEINLRFVFRYKNLVQQNSPRLLDPNWPEQLVEECAVAAGVSPKRDGFTRIIGTPR